MPHQSPATDARRVNKRITDWFYFIFWLCFPFFFFYACVTVRGVATDVEGMCWCCSDFWLAPLMIHFYLRRLSRQVFFRTLTARPMLTEWWLINCFSLSLFLSFSLFPLIFVYLFVSDQPATTTLSNRHQWMGQPPTEPVVPRFFKFSLFIHLITNCITAINHFHVHLHRKLSWLFFILTLVNVVTYSIPSTTQFRLIEFFQLNFGYVADLCWQVIEDKVHTCKIV